MPTDSELVDRITSAQELVQTRTEARTRIEGRLETFQGELTTFRDSLSAQGIDPTKLDELIAEAERDVEAKLTALETALNEQAQG